MLKPRGRLSACIFVAVSMTDSMADFVADSVTDSVTDSVADFVAGLQWNQYILNIGPKVTFW